MAGLVVQPVNLEFMGAFESTYLPGADADIFETSDHVRRRGEDLHLLRQTGISRLRYPIRWHRIERSPGRYNWSDADESFEAILDLGMTPVIDLIHHTSYPRWIERGFADPAFPDAYLRFARAVAERYSWIREYTVFNEPFATLFLCGHEGIWPPYGRGMEPLVEIFKNVLPAIGEASRIYQELLPEAEHVYVDTCEGHSGIDDWGRAYAELANDRRFFVLDLLLGREIDPKRPFVQEVIAAGGDELLAMEPGKVDVLGLDYYAHSEWSFGQERGHTPSHRPVGLAALMAQYHQRYGLPLVLSETNIRGYAPDRVSWLKYTLEQCELAVEAGLPLTAYCWFPFIDSVDWDSLLARADGHIDPVGVYWLDERLERRTSSFSDAFRLVAAGGSSSALSAYRFQPPLDKWLRGFVEHQMGHWQWQDPPEEEIGMCANTRTIHTNWEVVDGFV